MDSAFVALFSLLLLLLSRDAVSLGVDDDSDLATYVTRPEFRPPLFHVTTYIPESITPGYWFTAPYTSLYDEVSSEIYETCQVGPHIYDHEGDLVWTGACLVKNRPACDFGVSSYYNSQSLSMVLAPDPRHEEDDPRGVGWIMDPNFELRKSVHMHDMIPSFNMHEFNILDSGKTALVVTKEEKLHNVPFLGTYGPSSDEIEVEISHNGFQEIDILTGEVLFWWDAMDHVPLSETLVPLAVSEAGNQEQLWDYIHMNSVDKNFEGDYLISGRHTSAIYKVSGEDGSIIWQLGGLNCSFEQIGFDFSFQHDARFQYQEGPITIISYLNNAADMETETAEYSTAQLVKLDTDLMTATLVTEWDRPDHKLTRRRGNVQVLDNGNIFVGWSANSYISEFTPDGELVFEAQFQSERFSTYRSYKFNFTGSPSEPPTLRSFAYGSVSSSGSTSTVSYVSWNGATEVASWNFYASANDTSLEEFTYIGNTNRSGFETMFTVDGYMRYVLVEGIDKDGNVLGNSSVEETELYSNWASASSGDSLLVRIPLPIIILFFCVCAIGTIFGVVYSLRRRVTWLCGTNYHKIEDEAGSDTEGGQIDLEKLDLEEEDSTQDDGDYDVSDYLNEDDRR